MRPLDALRRFILAKQDEGAPEEVRLYANENVTDIAEAFGISADTFRSGIAAVDDDAQLARRLLGKVDRARANGREAKARDRTARAQEAADAIGASAHWRGEGAEIDLDALLASALTSRDDELVFASEAFTVGIRMRPLVRFRQLRRRDARAFVDATGLHIRWGSAGGLNFPTCAEPNASKIIVNLAPRANACEAA